jgi:dipeptidyl aminopeptidase/acylaminoacyl peptidase
LVEAGFAVMQINFRGSGGFGKAVMNGGLKTWGSVIQHDIIDATKSVVDKGLVNGDRICIYGGSFGGYSALMAPLVEPSLFKCAIGFVGVYDLPFLYESGDIPLRKSGIRFLERAIGRDMEQLRSFSPVYRASELNLPIMIIHGEEDPRAPVEHAYAMMQALDAANKPYRKLMFAKEGHGLYNPEARSDMYQQMIAFFSEHLL